MLARISHAARRSPFISFKQHRLDVKDRRAVRSLIALPVAGPLSQAAGGPRYNYYSKREGCYPSGKRKQCFLFRQENSFHQAV